MYRIQQQINIEVARLNTANANDRIYINQNLSNLRRQLQRLTNYQNFQLDGVPGRMPPPASKQIGKSKKLTVT